MERVEGTEWNRREQKGDMCGFELGNGENLVVRVNIPRTTLSKRSLTWRGGVTCSNKYNHCVSTRTSSTSRVKAVVLG